MKISKWMMALGVVAVAAAASAQIRVVCLGGAITETVWALGRGDAVVAVDDSSVYPPGHAALPRVGYYRMVSAEGLLSVNPELVLAHEQSGPPEVMEQLMAAGVRVVRIPSSATVTGLLARVRAVGEALGRSEAGAALAASLEADLAAITAAAPSSTPRVVFVFARGAGTLQVSGFGTAADEIIRLAGGVNAIEGFSGYRPLTAEALVAANPDVILATTSGLGIIGGPDALWSIPGVAATQAGEHRRVVAMDDLYLLGFGPRLPAAIAELREALTP
ncbi:MAG TPA: hemin ABC transporter substrate-binding protein [Kiritimatiellia bacterium]|nr:hemin ABC transporter substrate-binding protein [Kiritimatiellia bacterium]HMP33228.1 hemin ABC transporter substrate-binding protein [Kiritimatiellia bacterium]